MGRGPCVWKQTDVQRAIKAVAATGQPVGGVRFDKDGFTVVIGEPHGSDSNDKTENDWDEIVDGKA
jgi:hypothetical protein